MKVEKVNQNLQNFKTPQAQGVNTSLQQVYWDTQNTSCSPNFCGKYNVDDIHKELMKYMPKKIKGMLFLKKHIGEVQNIIINSIGTGLIAPLFIKYNPLSKTDEDTRTYSAWRQPVSAVLAILTQVGATIPFNNKVTSMANEGKLGQAYNMTPFMDESYLKKRVKQDHPDYTESKVKERVKQMRASQREDILKDLRTKNTVMFIEDSKPNKVAINPERLKKTLEATIDNLIKDEEIEKTQNSTTKRSLRIQRSEYYRNNPEKSYKLLDELDEIFKSGDIKNVKSALAEKLNHMKSQNADKELIKFTKEIYLIGDKSKDNGVIKSMVDKVGRARTYVHDYSAMTSKEQVIERVDKSLELRRKQIDETIKFFEKVSRSIKENKTVHEIEKMFTEEIKTNKRLQEKSIKFAEKAADQLLKETKACIGSYKQVGGLFVSLATLFVSCPLLNWIYPKFMAAVFPNLSNSKHTKDTSELIQKAGAPEVSLDKREAA